MILIDSSVWIDHIRAPEEKMDDLLTGGAILQHPFATAEVALGSFRNRVRFVAMLNALPQAFLISPDRLLDYAEEAGLPGTGVGMVDTHLLASTAATEGARLWTRDKRLAVQAERLGLNYTPD